jgi:integrase
MSRNSGYPFGLCRARSQATCTAMTALGPVWRTKYRLDDGRQVHRKIGPAWSGRGRPPAGFYTRRLAQEWLDAVLVRARAGTLPGAVRTGATFADACDEYLRFLERDRQRKPSTLRDARSIVRNHLLPAFGERRLEDVSSDLVERWARELGRDRPLSNRSKQKIIVVFHGLMERARRVWKLESNPVRDVDRPQTAASAGGIDVFSPDEVFALVRHADDEQDGALFLLAAFTGLPPGRAHRAALARRRLPGRACPRDGELHDPRADVAQERPGALGAVGAGGRQRACALARLSQRDHWIGDDLVFPGITGTYLDASALLKRYKRALAAAGLRPLRFHDYADLWIMPTRGRNSLVAAVSPAASRHNPGCLAAAHLHQGSCTHPAVSGARTARRLVTRPSKPADLPAHRMVLKKRALAWTIPPARTRPATGCTPRHPGGARIMPTSTPRIPPFAGISHRRRHNPEVGIIVVVPTSA